MCFGSWKTGLVGGLAGLNQQAFEAPGDLSVTPSHNVKVVTKKKREDNGRTGFGGCGNEGRGLTGAEH